MNKYIFYTLFLLFITSSVFAKTLDQKKNDLKKAYEAGGISKIEYNKALEFLEKPKKEKNTKKKVSFKKNKDKKKDKDKELEEITLAKINQLGKPVKFDNSYFPEAMIKKFRGCNNSFKCKGQKAGGELFKTFNRTKSYSQKNPGKMIKAMGMYEVFYASKLWYARKSLERYKEDNYKKILFQKRKRKR